MKILIVGLGSIGQRHLRNILRILGPGVQISAFRQRGEQTVLTEAMTVEAGAALDKKYNYTLYNSFEQALENFPQAVFICNPTRLHMPVALASAKQGCHLFIEKPLSHNLDGAAQLDSLVSSKNLTAFVGFQMRFHPCFLKLKEILKERKLGKLLSVHIEMGEYLPDWHKWEDYRRTHAARKDLGGGVVLTQMHDIDYALDLFGMPRSVYALGGHFSFLELDVEDSADFLMEVPYQDRILPVFMHMDYLQRPPVRRCKVVGDQGRVQVDFLGPQVLLETESGQNKFSYESFVRNQMYLDELEHFFACIRQKKQPCVDIKTAVKGMKVALAAKESLEKKNKILLES